MNKLAEVINYEEEYKNYINSYKKSSNKDSITSCCPFPHHDDSSPSFSASLKTGQYICFGCKEQGNLYTFLEKMTGTDRKTIYRQLCDKYSVPIGEEKEPTPPKLDNIKIEGNGYSPEQYAREKNFDEYIVTSKFDITKEGKWIKIPYKKENGDVAYYKYRTSNKRFKSCCGQAFL